ncbi:HNH endonuclease [bacterium]|nr:HNH endonuclease [bacterium]
MTRKKPKRKPLPREVVHQLQKRDRGRCTYVSPGGKRCNQTRWLHYHHLLPVASGGKDTVKNLMTVCSVHHRLTHEKDRNYEPSGLSEYFYQGSKKSTNTEGID